MPQTRSPEPTSSSLPNSTFTHATLVAEISNSGSIYIMQISKCYKIRPLNNQSRLLNIYQHTTVLMILLVSSNRNPLELDQAKRGNYYKHLLVKSMMPECVNKWVLGINWNQGLGNHQKFPSHLAAPLCWFDSYPSATNCFLWLSMYMRGNVNPVYLL